MPHRAHLTITREYTLTGDGTAAEALRTRVRRLREAHTPYTVDGLTVTFTDADGVTSTLTYSDEVPE